MPEAPKDSPNRPDTGAAGSPSTGGAPNDDRAISERAGGGEHERHPNAAHPEQAEDSKKR